MEGREKDDMKRNEGVWKEKTKTSATRAQGNTKGKEFFQISTLICYANGTVLYL